jgi:hypothetical protein
MDGGSDFDDSTIFTGSLAERISFVRKQSKAKRSCKQEVMMRAEFRYKGHGKEMVVRIVRRETGLLAAVAILGRVISFLGGIKKLLGF